MKKKKIKSFGQKPEKVLVVGGAIKGSLLSFMVLREGCSDTVMLKVVRSTL